MDKYAVAQILYDIGTMLELKGENFFKAKAYYDGARTVELLEESLDKLVAENRLKEIKGFGEALTQKVTELVTTGKMEYYEKLKASIPEGLMEMLKIPGLGAKKVAAIYNALSITTVGELKYACLENRLAKLPGFGLKTQAKVLEGIENLDRYKSSFLYSEALYVAKELEEYLRSSGKAVSISIAGSLRRMKEVVKDVDIIASSGDPQGLMEVFASSPLVAQVTSKGETKSSATLINGINADLRVVEEKEFPFALHHFTGSKEHNTALRRLAREQNFKMNEYGLFDENDGRLIECRSEEDIFKVFGMQYIPPELREDNGELEAARANALPRLVTLEDIKGVLHVHSNYSDGTSTIEEMIKACIARGYSYLGFADHSKSAFYAGGLKKDDIFRQHEEIEKLKQKYPGFTIFKGIELEILPDGSIDYEDDILELFDFTIASVHSVFNMDEDKMTERVKRAIKNRHVNILGHPTGRLLLSREPYKINMDEIIRTAAEEGVALEINANPHRLDLDWRLCKSAKEQGCVFAISPDAHRADGIDDIVYGVNVARKGWLTADDIVNARDASGFQTFFSRR